MHKHSVQSAKFAVLKSIDMPSLLIETAFISNPHEARNLMNKAFQTKMASAIALGLTKFVERNAQKPRWGESLYVQYKVQRGDTLSQIAANYQVSTQRLKKINNIKNANELYVGKKVKIPLSKKVVATL
jgi:N-acetylmuramoyl-L-alanine amidase